MNYEKFKNTEVGKSLGQLCTKFVFSDNFLQSKFRKVEKFSEIEQNQETLISVLDVNLWEKNFDRITAYSCRTNIFIQFHHFKEKTMDTYED